MMLHTKKNLPFLAITFFAIIQFARSSNDPLIEEQPGYLTISFDQSNIDNKGGKSDGLIFESKNGVL